MALLNTSNITTSTLDRTTTNEFNVDPRQTDGVMDQDETEWMNSRWTVQYGYYLAIPELKRAIDAKALWTVGKGYKAGRTINGVFTQDFETEVILDNIKGYGRDTFNSILKNLLITRMVGGDAFAEIIRDEETGQLINLKPLDPGSMKIVFNKQGQIKRYEQTSKTKGQPPQKFKVHQIFHLTKDRVADSMHGTSIIDSVELLIKYRNGAMATIDEVVRRFGRPMMKYEIDTDQQSKRDAIIRECDKATADGKNLYIPMGTVKHEIIAVPDGATMNILPWIRETSGFFFQAVGIPAIILGNSTELTESNSKIAYLSFEQSVEDDQLEIESQVWQQLALRIELDFPASLKNELLTDEAKDANQGKEFQPGDTTAGVAR